jgi:hypothetical protein
MNSSSNLVIRLWYKSGIGRSCLMDRIRLGKEPISYGKRGVIEVMASWIGMRNVFKKYLYSISRVGFESSELFISFSRSDPRSEPGSVCRID